MAAKDDKPGLLSKVAMFVRNPTKDWSELDQPQDSEANGYDKQALKAMIERKRQNDFVRKREFDQLRKLRNRDPQTLANVARPSFFQTSLPSDVDGRADTLKKIDAIEAQMSHQWWKNKGDGAGDPHAEIEVPGGKHEEPMPPSDGAQHGGRDGLTVPFARTEPVHMRPSDEIDSENVATQMGSDLLPVPPVERMPPPDAPMPPVEMHSSFSTSRLFAIDSSEVAADPELEEAAIRFANGDDAGAEKGLLAALDSQDSPLQDAQSWIYALLDLYRATDNRAAFDAAIWKFALHQDGPAPVWVPLGTGTAKATSGEPIWVCPATLTAHSMEFLRAAMLSQPLPWVLDWRALEAIAVDAVPLLDALFASLCDEAVSLHFSGTAQVVRALRSMTPTGDRRAPLIGWNVRLNALRAMGLQDDFELAALDYCVTFEAAPPDWVQPHCHMVLTDDEAGGAWPGEPMQEGDVALVLRGDVLGDAMPLLTAQALPTEPGARLIVDCSDLVRVDFAAAGSILSWVAMRQAEGRQVQFCNVHRLVAAFFSVIGINEYAKVVARAF